MSEKETSFAFVSLDQHRKFLEQSHDELVELCRQDPVLSEVVPLLTACPNDDLYRSLVTNHLNARVEHHFGRAYRVTLIRFDGGRSEIYIPQHYTVHQLRQAIQRDVSIELEVRAREEGRKVKKMFRELNWKRIWRRFDLWLDREHRISLLPPTHPATDLPTLTNQSNLEFIPKSRAS